MTPYDQKTILIPHFLEGNSFLRALGRSYQAQGGRVIYGPENLHEIREDVFLIHLHWPESIYRWGTAESPEWKAAEFIQDLRRLKMQGAKIVWSVHNLYPHENPDDLDQKIYQEVIALADLILHHCSVSRDLLQRKYQLDPHQRQIVVPLGSYFHVTNQMSKEAARHALNLPMDGFVFLHFGYIRRYKGLFVLIRSFLQARVKNKYLMIAGSFSAASERPVRFDLVLLEILSRFYDIRLHLYWIPEDEIQKYMNASDALVLSHLTGLNSGLAVLGMSFGKLVIGPKVGGLPEVLNAGSNIVYEPTNKAALKEALEGATKISPQAVEAINLQVSSEWTWEAVVKKIASGLNLS